MVASSAMAQSPFPAAAELREAKLMRQIGPQTWAWIAQEAAQMQEPSEAAAFGAVRAKAPMLGKLNNSDIEELVSVVMMEAARDADEDLRTLLDDVQKINKAQAALRQSRATATAGGIGAAQAGRLPSAPTPLSHRLGAQQPIQPRPLPRSEFDSRLAALLNDKDGLEEMRGTEELRLRLVTDRRSRALETLSNFMKRLTETRASFTRDLP